MGSEEETEEHFEEDDIKEENLIEVGKLLNMFDPEEQKKRITSVENLHCLSLDDADTLPDLDEKLHGNQSGRNSSLNELNSFTGKQYVRASAWTAGNPSQAGNTCFISFVKFPRNIFAKP